MTKTFTAVSGSTLLDINGEQPKNKEINPKGYYFVDWTKMSNVQDLVVILAAVGFNFSPSHPHFDAIKPLLDLENPVIPNQQ